ncbi:MAG: hypothetical protein SFT90_08270 [Rickettsiales bacterium]|nr:hypothetical protein [Rickettsiales bacterium]
MSVNTYAFECKINTLASCVGKMPLNPNSFEFEGIKFAHWEFNFAEGWKPGGWLVTGKTQAGTFHEARIELWHKLNDLIPKIAMISQCYTEYLQEPFIIHRLDTDVALFYYSKATSGVPLHFDEQSQEALALLANKKLSNEFYYYWNDMLNSTGYPAKLLLICSALEALGKALGRDKKEFRIEILGDDLSNKVFEPHNGIRHRLTHGEYFSEKDSENYLNQIYEKITQYFNDKILEKHLIRNVVNPQRHPWGNKKAEDYYLQKKPENLFSLREMLDAFDRDFEGSIKNFKVLSPEEYKNL